tara:strand:+ start:6969 stop:7328 length:360 start_codon:yes stop_codon:yes gene_type:complete
MRKYKVVCRYGRINAGFVELTKDQARRRRHCLDHLEDNVYLLKEKTGFKSGEVFGFDGDLSRDTNFAEVESKKDTDEKAALTSPQKTESVKAVSGEIPAKKSHEEKTKRLRRPHRKASK